MSHACVLPLALLLVACGGAQPARAPTEQGQASGAPSTASSGAPEAASNGQPEEEAERAVAQAETGSERGVKTVDTHTAEDTHGVKASNIKPTKTEGVLKFIIVDKDKGPVEGIAISLTGIPVA